MLGVPVQPADDPVALADIDLPSPRFDLPDHLAAYSTCDAEVRIRHTYGRAYPDILRGYRGDFSPAPDWVAHPRNEEDIAALLSWASQDAVVVVPYGGGTSVVGGVERELGSGHRGSISLDMRGLNRVLEVDVPSLSAKIEAGATGPGLERQLAQHGLTLRHFPQSFEFSTLGGWLATRAGGHFATVYTHIDDLVSSIRMVTPSGVVESRRLPGSGAGPSPDRLMLGSEGILGVITQAWMRVRPRPTFRATASLRFVDYHAAVEAVRSISQSGLFPSNCRLLDKREAMLNAVSFDGSHILIVAFESADHAVEAWMTRAIELAAKHGGTCPDGPTFRDDSQRTGDAGQAGAWKQAFFEGPYLQSSLVSLGVIADTFETACPWDRFEALHRDVIAAVRDAMERHCGTGFISCRFTHVYPDGPAPYFTWIAPARRGDELEQWQAVKSAASDALIAAGGTITHHHAVGRTHRPWYTQQRPELFADALRAVKRSWDPAGVLNPGVLLAPEDN